MVPDPEHGMRRTPKSPTVRVFEPTTPDAKRFAGQYLGDGTVQRNGEPILLVQRPPEPGLKIDSLKRWGTGAVNVDAYRDRYHEWPSTVFDVPRASQIEIAGCPHPTMKPVDLIRRFVCLFAPPGGLVLDPFAGSGTTGAAAVLEGRRSIQIEQDPDMRVWMRRRIKSTGAAISVNRSRKSIETSFAAARRAIERLDQVERRLTKVAAPYAARVTVEGVRLHLAGRNQPKQWRELLERHGITLRSSAKSPCQGTARLMFERSPSVTVAMYAWAMAWGLKQIEHGHTTLERLADLIVQEGGVQAVARAFSKSVGIRGRLLTITNHDYELAVSQLARVGMLVGDANLDIQEALALVRTDPKGRRVVHLIEADPHRVRVAVIRYSRREEPEVSQKKRRTS